MAATKHKYGVFFGDLRFSELREWFESSVSIGSIFTVFFVSQEFKYDLSMATF